LLDRFRKKTCEMSFAPRFGLALSCLGCPMSSQSAPNQNGATDYSDNYGEENLCGVCTLARFSDKCIVSETECRNQSKGYQRHYKQSGQNVNKSSKGNGRRFQNFQIYDVQPCGPLSEICLSGSRSTMSAIPSRMHFFSIAFRQGRADPFRRAPSAEAKPLPMEKVG
jgi:hypothetical protein